MENKEKLPGPVFIDVEPVSCSMMLTRSLDPKEKLPDSLSIQLRLDRGVELRTPDNRSLNSAKWGITFYENGSSSELTRLHNAVGQINYREEFKSEHYDIDDFPETCHAWANLDTPTFALLREMALAGKLPQAFRLEALGIEYGWEPDGSGKVWDVKAHKNVVISKIEFISDLVKPPEADQSEEEADAFWSEPKPESPEQLATRAMTKAIEKIDARLGWVVGLLALGVVILIFR
ncbi:MAG: hypothetical protein QM769_03420 [Pseudoxanthomonas sp.]